ncbi:minor head protein [Lachnospiraceae bacterium TWA4]|nr:minor head protein [Lachnospiraceae bacterium TWA4]
MNERQREVQKIHLTNEAKVFKELKQVYTQASKDCQKRILELSMRSDMTNIQAIVYQKQYQEILKKQIDSVLDELNSKSFTTVSEYLGNCYEDGFIGTLYDLQGQGVPLIFPINQDEVVKALQTDSKISEGLYSRMGEDTKKLKLSIRAELSRGTLNGSSWNQIAEKIAIGMNSPFNKALNRTNTIARTEGHRVQQASTFDCQKKAKERGADVLKQWDSTMDSKTRPTHQELDGQVREIDESFEVAGKKAMFPADFGDPSEDCNCRCCLLQRARWALSKEEYFTKWDGDAHELVKVESKTYNEFKEKVKEIQDIKDLNKLKNSGMSDADFKEYMSILRNHKNKDIRRIYNNYADEIGCIKLDKSGYYESGSSTIVFNYPLQKYIDNGRSKYSTLAHEYGHYFDEKADFGDLHFKEIDSIHDNISFGQRNFRRKTCNSDEFLEAVRKDKKFLKDIGFSILYSEMKGKDASHGVQDAIDGMFVGSDKRIGWGHGEKYYNRIYTSIKKMKDYDENGRLTVPLVKKIQSVYKSLGLDASNQSKVSTICRDYETSSEMWANIMSAETVGGEELEYIKKYLPNSYNEFLKIMKGVK